MGRMKNFDRAMYKDTYDAIFTLMEKELNMEYRSNSYVRIYNKKAFENALGFLCVNNIPHTYTITPLRGLSGMGEAKSVIALSWEEAFEDYKNCIFFSTIGSDENEV